jgi:hypothetical protein
MATPIERFSLAGPQAAPLTGAREDVQEGDVIADHPLRGSLCAD